METKIFDGRAAAAAVKRELKFEAEEKKLKPGLAVILVGGDPASLSYIGRKQKACEELGFGFRLIRLPPNSVFENFKFQISNLNGDPGVHGILVQLPLPPQLSAGHLIGLIDPKKEIDGLSPSSKFISPTAQAVLHVLNAEHIKINGASTVVLGRGKTAGAPIAKELKKRGARVFVASSTTPPEITKRYTLNADIIVSCVGKPNLINGQMIKEGAAVIGVGISSRPRLDVPQGEALKNTVQGDLDEKSLIGKASLITPTPGGIGPLTVAFLLKNLLIACENQSSSP